LSFGDNMSPRQLEHFAKIKRAKQAVLEWARTRGIPLVHIDHVATFEDWDHGIEVWFFFETDSEREQCDADGITRQLSDFYRHKLQEDDYDFAAFPEVQFHADSKQNVDAKFQGNYFYRLR
jgi:hypothetical protein